ncbi:hypothetical protein SPPR111872_23915 [Sphingobacterium prati]
MLYSVIVQNWRLFRIAIYFFTSGQVGSISEDFEGTELLLAYILYLSWMFSSFCCSFVRIEIELYETENTQSFS